METVLVTGGAGFIGSHVCDALLKKGRRVICVDNFNDYYLPKVKRCNISQSQKDGNFVLVEKDICNFESLKSVFKDYEIDKVVHLAARAGVRPSVDNPFIYEETNIRGTLNLLELSRQNRIKNFIFGSSSSVYGGNEKIPFSEEDKTDFPISPYAATKKAGEVLCYTYSSIYSLNVSCLRFFTVYGPRGRPDMAPYIFTKNISEGKKISVFGDGKTRRDYTFVNDIVGGILSCLEKNFRYEIFNLGNSKTVELNELIHTIETQVGKKAEIERKEIPVGDVLKTFADISKARKMLGYDPKTDIREGIREFVTWYNKQSSFSGGSWRAGNQK